MEIVSHSTPDKALFQYHKLGLTQLYPRVFLLHNNKKAWILKTYSNRKTAQREWNILTILSDLNLAPQPYLLSHEKNSSSLIMSYIPGMDLFEHIDHYGSFTERTIKPLLHTLLAQLSLIHRKNILHRDIKPENIIYTEDSTYFIDFEGRETTGYRSPELYKHRKASPASDIWALGITTFILITKHYPFTDDVTAYSEPLKCPSSWSILFQNLIQSMLEKDPHKRPSADTLLEHAFFNS